jgi:phage-related protein
LKIDWNREAEEELKQFDRTIQKEIIKQIERIPEKGTGWKKVEPLISPELDLEAFRLKIDPEEKENVNHRIIFDVKDDFFVIYKVGEGPAFLRKLQSKGNH